jgi:nitroimidazol reductase NimA-like FMN-containing flavoprotein (pyridoxamine 5'-phosphate oxidase superfamily)
VLIEELTEEASLNVLARTRLGRIACAQGDQPYVVPFYFTYDHHYLYSFSTVGKKIEWMRANPLVCVETDEFESSQQWVSIIVSKHAHPPYTSYKRVPCGGRLVPPRRSSTA